MNEYKGSTYWIHEILRIGGEGDLYPIPPIFPKNGFYCILYNVNIMVEKEIVKNV